MAKLIIINLISWVAFYLFSIKSPENMILITIGCIISIIITGLIFKEKEND
jgi:uncharacterized membrane protein